MEKSSMIFYELPVVISFVMLLETPFKLWYDVIIQCTYMQYNVINM